MPICYHGFWIKEKVIASWEAIWGPFWKTLSCLRLDGWPESLSGKEIQSFLVKGYSVSKGAGQDSPKHGKTDAEWGTVWRNV